MRPTVLILLLLLTITLFPVPVEAQASNNIYFERVKLTYSINSDWSTDVQMEFTLVNNSKSREITSISRSISSSNLQDVNVYDEDGKPLRHAEDKSDNQTTINVFFDGRAGPGGRITYFISFTAPDLLTERGPKHEAWLGGLKLGPNDLRCDKYVVEVRSPPGSRLFLCRPPSARSDNGNIRYETQLIPPQDFDGVYGVWYPGVTYYKITLTEELVNPGPKATRDIQLDIELFSHVDWQFAGLTGSSVPLETIYVDGENNWHGVFQVERLDPGQRENIRIDLVFLNRTYESGADGGNTGLLSDVPENLELYLHGDKYWEVGDQLIQQRAWDVVGSTNNAYLVAEEIIGFVGSYVNYEVTTERKGAVETLISREGDCDCFSDLTIALSRAIGLPSRLDMGWTYDGDELGGHAWVEFYLPNHGWVPADPLWAQNSGDYLGRLDPAHILRGIRGVRSEDSHVQFTYKGTKPSIHEYVSVNVLSELEASSEFISAAGIAVDVARELFEESRENLAQELALAEDDLKQALESSSPSQRLALSQESLKHANVVIRGLGGPPEEGPYPDLPGFLLLTIVIVLAVIAVTAGVWRHGREK